MSANKNIVIEENGVPVLENQRGCKLVPHRGGNSIGLGTFYLNGKKLGETIPYFAVEESVQRAYTASAYSIVENNPQRGIVRFTGKDGKLEFTVNITLLADSAGFRIDYEFYPIHPIYHRLFINVPFNNSAMHFVKYPYEDTLPAGFAGRWMIEPDCSRVPFLFGSEQVEGETCYVGVGYQLTDDFFNGRIEYDAQTTPSAPFKIYTPFKGMARPIDIQCVTRLELVRADVEEEFKRVRRDLKIVFSMAPNQYDCVKGYLDHSGYEPTVPFCRSIDDAISPLMSVYKNARNYFPGEGYTQIMRFDTGDIDTTIPHGWYSKYILVGPQIQLAYELYKYWEKHPEETWARERAFEMADFLVKMQKNDGAFSTYDADLGQSSVIHPQNMEATSFKSYLYSMCDMGTGVTNLCKLYEEVKEFEKTDRSDWQAAAIKAADYIIGRMGSNGEMGRNYSEDGSYDIETHGLSSPLMALHTIYQETGDRRFQEARDKLEEWLYQRYLEVNNFYNAGTDGGAWQGIQWPPPRNNDNMGVLSTAAYFAYRYMDTGEQKYLERAKDLVAYQWLTSIPVQFPEYKHVTKGLQREQDFYSAYDIPFRSKENIDCLPYLSKVTGDPFFMQFYRMLIQTELHYQAIDQPFPAIYIGLESDGTGRDPQDKLAEEKIGYIVKFASSFLKSVNSPYAYRYVGGEGWGVGLDYNLAFNPSLGCNAPYLLSASTLVRDMAWDADRHTLSVVLYDRLGRTGSLDIKWKPESYSLSEAEIEIDGRVSAAKDCYDAATGLITLKYVHEGPTKVVKIFCKGRGGV